MGRRQGIDPKPIVLEHLGVATLVVVAAACQARGRAIV
jgi:hypothetical protein